MKTASDIQSQTCPLCMTTDTNAFYRDSKRNYLRCNKCHLIYVPPQYFLSPAEEIAEYRLHQNSPQDPGYRRFLGRLFVPLLKRLPEKCRGLDFGSGPGPTLSVMFSETGHTMSIYDHFFAPDQAVLRDTYDFITASEVVEHLHHPGLELDKLWSCLKPGGWLGIMTKLALDQEAFASWHYKNDPTHVVFFSRATCQWLAERWQANLVFANKDVILLQKSTAGY